MLVQGWRRSVSVAAVIGVAVLGLSACTGSSAPAADASTAPGAASVEPVVGAWSVEVTGAPYGPHLFSFVPGGVMFTTNPTDVQSAGTDGTHDSVGFGTWRAKVGAPAGTYEGSFRQLNASAVTHKPTGTLLVTWVITIKGDTLTGSAQAGLSDAPDQTRPATFDGTRITVDETTLRAVAWTAV